MRCQKVVCSLHAYVDGELTEKRQRLVQDHLADCE
ncbi:MAG TPA: hypothetical protein ENI88_00580, partial [Desulfobulbus sp.]|nr:hypothetical protein [Desulfobulbus sp.]